MQLSLKIPQKKSTVLKEQKYLHIKVLNLSWQNREAMHKLTQFICYITTKINVNNLSINKKQMVP